MTQSYIQRAAGWGPIKRFWARLHEPRVISAIYGGWWTLATVLGGYSIIWPPRTIEALAGDVLMMIIAGFITIGGIVGMVSVARGAFWSERFAVAFAVMGLCGYLAMVGYLWWSSEGNRGLQSFALVGAALFTGIRLHWVNDRPYSAQRTRRNLASEEAKEIPGDATD